MSATQVCRRNIHSLIQLTVLQRTVREIVTPCTQTTCCNKSLKTAISELTAFRTSDHMQARFFGFCNCYHFGFCDFIIFLTLAEVCIQAQAGQSERLKSLRTTKNFEDNFVYRRSTNTLSKEMTGNRLISRDSYGEGINVFSPIAIITASGPLSRRPQDVVIIDQTGSASHHASMYIGVTKR